MLHEFFLVCYYLAPFWVPFFTLAGILSWISDRITERMLRKTRTTDTAPKEHKHTQRPAC